MLLVVAQIGALTYPICSIIVGLTQLVEKDVSDEKRGLFLCVVLTSLFTLAQILLQSCFILDASRKIPNEDQIQHKPGREAMIFLFVCNLFMWVINIYTTNQLSNHPFTKNKNWPTITHISMPLNIFYRFHSTVCLLQTWKECFKGRQQNKNH